MTFRLILGRAGGGKSSFIYDEVVTEVERDPLGAPLWVLVPEQSTFQVERALSDRLHGLMRVRVISFQRLAHIVMNAVAGAALVPVSDLGRLMLTRKVIEQHKNELRLFSRAASQPGFAAKVVELISELKRYRVRPDDLLAALESDLPITLSNKIHDLHLLYRALCAQYSAVSLDSDDRLEWLRQHIKNFSLVRDTAVYFDGFTGFTPQEYAIVEQLMGMSHVSMALTLEPVLLRQELQMSHPFYMPWETAKRCQEIARHRGLSTDLITPAARESFDIPAELVFLEQAYFDFSATPWREPSPVLRLVSAQTRRAEVEFLAREIIALCRERNFRFRDISVVTRDLALYAPLLDEVFPSYDIPYFLDKKRAVAHHPALDLVKSLLEAVEHGFPYEATLRCLKTDLWPIERAIIDRIDNIALAKGLRGSAWTSTDDWGGLNADEQHVVNEARSIMADLLGEVTDDLKAATNVGELARSVMTFLEKLQIPHSLESWAVSAQSQGDVLSAKLHRQVWSAIVQLFAELSTTLGAETLDLRSFSRVVESGLEGILLGVVPPCLDQVLVSQLGRSRTVATRAAFLLGVNDGLLPARPSTQGLLTDDERLRLEHCQIGLGPSAYRQLFEEEFLVYTGLTRAAELLCISFTAANDDGVAMRASSVVRRLQYLFPNTKIEHVDLEPPSPEEALSYLAHRRNAAALLAAECGRMTRGQTLNSLWFEVYDFLSGDAEAAELVMMLRRGLSHHGNFGPLAPHLVRRLYGRTLRGSVSRLEKYRECPFAHFAGYALGLKERRVYKLEAVDIGNFFHQALENFATEMHDDRLAWSALTPELCRSLATRVVTQMVPTMGILSSSARHRYLTRRLQQVVERSARILGNHAQRGKFDTVSVELGFGGPCDVLPPVTITLKDGSVMELTGRIDRVDTATDGDKLYIAVIDYKSGYHELSPLEVYYGLKTQLLAYLDVVLQLSEDFLPQKAEPAAALYFRVHDPVTRSSQPLEPDEVHKKSIRDFRFRGVVAKDPAIVKLLDVHAGDHASLIPVGVNERGVKNNKVAWTPEQINAMLEHLRCSFQQAGEEIVAGDVSIAPYRLGPNKACTYCQFVTVCQFDGQIKEHRFRQLDARGAAAVWAELGTQGGGENGEVD